MVVVYANIIDVIGKRLYSGNIVWVREYVQNAYDAGANNVTIKVGGNDITIEDDGNGMGLDEINNQLFSLGGSVKTQEKIGQFGIGAYAGTGICNEIKIRTRKGNGPIYIVTLDMKKYNKIIGDNRFVLFDDVIKEIYSISKEKEQKEDAASFTIFKFIEVQIDTIRQIVEKDGKMLREVLEDYVPLELSYEFPHKIEIENFLAQKYEEEQSLNTNERDINYRNLKVTLELEGKVIPIRKYINKNFEFLPDLMTQDVKGNSNKTIAKLWALYSENGTTLRENASFILRYKGVAVGGHDVLKQFGVKDTKRFIGEIIITGLDLELNTQRSWFVESTQYSEFMNKIKPVLKKLYEIASFDSKLGNGLLRKYSSLEQIREELREERKKGNKFNVSLLDTKARHIEAEIGEKLAELKAKVSKIEEDDSENQFKFYNEALQSISKKVFEEIPIEKVEQKIETLQNIDKEWNSSAFVRSLLERYIVSDELVEVTSHKNSKDTLNNVFTLIETKLKEKLGFNVNLQKDAKFWSMVAKFTDEYKPPLFVDPNDKSAYTDAFVRFMTGAYGVFRNPSSHTFIEHYKDERYNIQFLILGDILLSLIETWQKGE